MQNHPAFGQANLSNCERELIHLAGSVQPHGVLLVLSEPDFEVLQVSANSDALLGLPPARLLGRPLAALGGDVDAALGSVAAADLSEPTPFRCRIGDADGGVEFEASAHGLAEGGVALELEPLSAPADAPFAVDLPDARLAAQVQTAVERVSNVSSIGPLTDAVVRELRDLTGYDRVMVYRFDPDGHGKVVAESRDPRLEPLLGHHYPATDIPQRARELYVRTRVRVLVDVDYEPAPLVPAMHPVSGTELDMSLCHLRSMSPLHLQYLRNMGVTATLVVSLVREGRLWGLIACHHYSPRNLRYPVRAATELLAEVIATRIAAIENYVHAQVALLVRRLEQRLVEATSTEGDWRYALFRNPRTLLQPLGATGAALFHDGEVLTAGEVPSTPELRALLDWMDGRAREGLYSCASVSRENPELAGLTPTASGVLGVKLSAAHPDYLVWFRKEQLQTVTWAGDPNKPMIGDDPTHLSPRRSFAAWSEIVRGTALPWTGEELALAQAIGVSLVDIILQVHAVRLLIADHQLERMRATVRNSQEPVVIADAGGRLLTANDAFLALAGRERPGWANLRELASLFRDGDAAGRLLRALEHQHQAGRGELELLLEDGSTRPVSLRAEVVPGSGGATLGFILIFVDLTESRRAAAARRQLEVSLSEESARLEAVTGLQDRRGRDEVVNAILANASLAAMDIADGAGTPTIAPLLEEVEASTRRATSLYTRLRAYRGENR